MVFGSEAKCQGSPPCPCLSLICPSHKEPSRSKLGQHFQAFSSAGMSCRICGPPGTWTPCPVASFHSLSSMGAPDSVHAILLTSSSVQHYKAAPLRFDFPVDQPGHRSYGGEYLRWIFRYIWTFLTQCVWLLVAKFKNLKKRLNMAQGLRNVLKPMFLPLL